MYGAFVTLALVIAPELTALILTLIEPFPLSEGSLLTHRLTLTLFIADTIAFLGGFLGRLDDGAGFLSRTLNELELDRFLDPRIPLSKSSAALLLLPVLDRFGLALGFVREAVRDDVRLAFLVFGFFGRCVRDLGLVFGFFFCDNFTRSSVLSGELTAVTAVVTELTSLGFEGEDLGT